MKYERLTNSEYFAEIEYCKPCSHYHEPNGCNYVNGECCQYHLFTECYDRLREFEDKIENGTLIELPCKVGDTVYYTLKDEDLFVGKIVGIAIEPNGTWVHAIYNTGLHMWHKSEDIGKDIFLIRSEAEKKLEELRGE